MRLNFLSVIRNSLFFCVAEHAAIAFDAVTGRWQDIRPAARLEAVNRGAQAG